MRICVVCNAYEPKDSDMGWLDVDTGSTIDPYCSAACLQAAETLGPKEARKLAYLFYSQHASYTDRL